MQNISKVLCPVDFSEASQTVLKEAMPFIQGLGATEVHLVHVLEWELPPVLMPEVVALQYSQEYHRSVAEIGQRKLANVAKTWENTGIKIVTRFMESISTTDALIEYVQSEGIDLMVMGTHGRRGFQRYLMGSVAEAMVQKAPCPVLTFHRPDSDPHAAWLSGTRSIVVPFDFSTYAETAWEVGKGLAQKFSAEVVLLHNIVEEGMPNLYRSYRAYEVSKEEVRAEAAAELEKFVATHGGTEVPYRIVLTAGHTTQEIVKYVEQNAPDLVVIATHGLSGLAHFLMGSVAEKVVRMAPCPILTLKRL